MYYDDICSVFGLLVAASAGVGAVQPGAVLVWVGHVGCNLTPGNFIGNFASSPVGAIQTGIPWHRKSNPENQ